MKMIFFSVAAFSYDKFIGHMPVRIFLTEQQAKSILRMRDGIEFTVAELADRASKEEWVGQFAQELAKENCYNYDRISLVYYVINL